MEVTASEDLPEIGFKKVSTVVSDRENLCVVAHYYTTEFSKIGHKGSRSVL